MVFDIIFIENITVILAIVCNHFFGICFEGASDDSSTGKEIAEDFLGQIFADDTPYGAFDEFDEFVFRADVVHVF